MHSALKLSLSTLALALTALAAPAHAQPASAPSATATAAPAAASMPHVDRRQARQQARIAQGAASGALTGHETRRLEREQAAIGKAEDKAKADGTVTPQERHRLAHMQNRASRDIHHQKHDRQTAPAAASASK